MNQMYVNIAFGFILSNLIILYTRSKDSRRTPYHLSILFFFKDNWARWIVSLLISYTVAAIVDFNDFTMIPREGMQGFLVWFSVGGSTDTAIHLLNKYTGILTPKSINFKGEKYLRK